MTRLFKRILGVRNLNYKPVNLLIFNGDSDRTDDLELSYVPNSVAGSMSFRLNHVNNLERF